MSRNRGRPPDEALGAVSLLIHESELQALAAISAEREEAETGGELLGLWTHGERAVVQFVTGPGPNAVHQETHFAQDIEHFRATTKFFFERFGIQLLGPWHSHWRLGLDRPSSGDAEQIRSISTRNNFSRLIEIITTHENAKEHERHPSPCSVRGRVTPTRGWRWWRWPAGGAVETDLCVKINSFVHTDPQSGRARRCRIHVLPGVSPVRLALRHRGLLNGVVTGMQDLRFPMDRIVYDWADVEAKAGDQEKETSEVPALLAKQCRKLPKTVLEGMAVTVNDELVVFKLPTATEGSVIIVCDREVPHCIKGVAYEAPGETILRDLTADALAEDGSPVLAQVYTRVISGQPGLNRRSIATGVRTIAGAVTKRCGKRNQPGALTKTHEPQSTKGGAK